MLGIDGLKALLDRHAGGDAEAQLSAVSEMLQDGTGGQRLHDDLTMLAIG